MDEVRVFIKNHKKEILVVSAGIVIYRIGFNKGFNTAKNAMNYIFEEAARTIPIKF